MNQRTKALLAPVAAIALAFSIAACGSDDDASSDTTTAATTAIAEATTPMEGTTDMGGEMAGGEATAGDITVTDVWIREPAEGQTLSAAYGTITNNGDADVTLIGGSVPFDATVEIHETTTDADGKMQMQEVPEGFVVPAGGSFTLEPGGPHIMLIDIDPADIVGTIDVTMIFDDGTEVTVGAPVKALDMGGDMTGDMTGTTMAG
ncbi:MAG TPA: copper chaperone PCu(A)C [Ilumatobacteraceae bacterium]|nr:copper chaperone PCu(A)C [Ilumatobacteraceae bacterium]